MLQQSDPQSALRLTAQCVELSSSCRLLEEVQDDQERYQIKLIVQVGREGGKGDEGVGGRGIRVEE